MPSIDVGASMIHGLTEDLIKQIQDALTLSEGTISFRFRSNQLFDCTPYDAIILPPIRSGETWIRLDRVASTLYLRFIHSSPTTGTRKGLLDLASLKGSQAVRIALIWSPGKIGLTMVDATNPARGALSTSASPQEFVIDFSDKPEQNQNFTQILDSLGSRLTKLTGLRLTQVDHPFVGHFVLAKQHYESNNRRLGFKEAAHSRDLEGYVHRAFKEWIYRLTWHGSSHCVGRLTCRAWKITEGARDQYEQDNRDVKYV